MEYDSYIRSLTSQYGLKEASVEGTIRQLQEKLNQDKIKLQQLFKEKLVSSKAPGKKSSNKSSAYIKQLTEQIQDLIEDIGELETSLLILRHKLPPGNIILQTLYLLFLFRNPAGFER